MYGAMETNLQLVREKARRDIRGRCFDLVVKAAQALFVDGIPINKSNVEKQMGKKRGILKHWLKKSSVLENVFYQYQKLQRN